MATDLGPNLDFSAPAGADLSALQYTFVKFSGANVVTCAAVTDKPCGILQNKPTSGQTAEVRALGVSKVVAAGALATIGTLVGTDGAAKAAAKVVGTDVTHYGVGTTKTVSGGANEVITVFVNCLAPARAA